MIGVSEIVYEDETLKQAHCNNLHVAAWFDAPTLAQMHAYGRAARSLAERFQGKSGLMNVVVGGVPRFSSEVRAAAAQYTSEGAHTAGAAHVILVDGLLGSSVRAFLSTVVLIGRPPNPTRVFGELGEAAGWMAGRLSESSSEQWDADAVAGVCRAILERR